MANKIEAAVAPLKADAIAWAEREARGFIGRVEKELEANGWRIDIVAPFPKGNHWTAEVQAARAKYHLYGSLVQPVSDFTMPAAGRSTHRGDGRGPHRALRPRGDGRRRGPVRRFRAQAGRKNRRGTGRNADRQPRLVSLAIDRHEARWRQRDVENPADRKRLQAGEALQSMAFKEA
jgi:hypothetical protein